MSIRADSTVTLELVLRIQYAYYNLRFHSDFGDAILHFGNYYQCLSQLAEADKKRLSTLPPGMRNVVNALRTPASRPIEASSFTDFIEEAEFNVFLYGTFATQDEANRFLQCVDELLTHSVDGKGKIHSLIRAYKRELDAFRRNKFSFYDVKPMTAAFEGIVEYFCNKLLDVTEEDDKTEALYRNFFPTNEAIFHRDMSRLKLKDFVQLVTHLDNYASPFDGLLPGAFDELLQSIKESLVELLGGDHLDFIYFCELPFLDPVYGSGYGDRLVKNQPFPQALRLLKRVVLTLGRKLVGEKRDARPNLEAKPLVKSQAKASQVGSDANSDDAFQLVDIAIVTILPEEYEAVLGHLSDPDYFRGNDTLPNLYGWTLGNVRHPRTGRRYRVVLAIAGGPGLISGSQVTTNTVRTWSPRYVLLSGIAGGLPREGLKKGDVVVSTNIWNYEYGKVEETFEPRLEYDYQIDIGLRNSALAASRHAKWHRRIGRPAPSKTTPKVLFGPIASGNKLVDRVDTMFQPVLKKWPKLLAIEMEGAGAAAAIEELRAEGRSPGFLMIRGICDMPLSQRPSRPKKAQSKQRDEWKSYASQAAAAFAIHMIQDYWPIEPSS